MAKSHIAISGDRLCGRRDWASREDRARLAGTARGFGRRDVRVVGRARRECRASRLGSRPPAAVRENTMLNDYHIQFQHQLVRTTWLS